MKCFQKVSQPRTHCGAVALKPVGAGSVYMYALMNNYWARKKKGRTSKLASTIHWTVLTIVRLKSPSSKLTSTRSLSKALRASVSFISVALDALLACTRTCYSLLALASVGKLYTTPTLSIFCTCVRVTHTCERAHVCVTSAYSRFFVHSNFWLLNMVCIVYAAMISDQLISIFQTILAFTVCIYSEYSVMWRTFK
jgi:hypothetical protein